MATRASAAEEFQVAMRVQKMVLGVPFSVLKSGLKGIMFLRIQAFAVRHLTSQKLEF